MMSRPLLDGIYLSAQILRPKRPRGGLRRAVTFLSAWAWAASLGGCAGSECPKLREEYARAMKAAPALRGEPQGPATLALEVKTEALSGWINEALQREGDTRSLKQDTPVGSLQARLKDLRVSVALDPGCERCVRLTARGKLRATGAAFGVPLALDEQDVTLKGSLPLKLKATKGRSELLADLSGVKLERLKLSGVPGWAQGPLEVLALDLASGLLQKLGGEFALARWEPLALPGGSLKVAPSELRTLAAQDALWIGFSSNLPAPKRGLAPVGVLGKGEEVAVSFSAESLGALMRGLMAQGALPARFDDALKPDPKGVHRATVRGLTPNERGARLALTLWRLPEEGGDDRCYAVDVQAQGQFHVKQGEALDVALDDFEVTQTRGDDTLLRLGLWWDSELIEGLEQVQTTVLRAETLQLGPLGQRELRAARVIPKGEALSVVVQTSTR